MLADGPDDVLHRVDIRPKSQLLGPKCDCVDEKNCWWLDNLIPLEESVSEEHPFRQQTYAIKLYVRQVAKY